MLFQHFHLRKTSTLFWAQHAQNVNLIYPPKFRRAAKETCPNCQKPSPVSQLLNEFCPWCGWQSAQALHNEGRATKEHEVGDPADRQEISREQS